MKNSDLKDVVDEARQYRESSIDNFNKASIRVDTPTLKALLFFKINKDVLIYENRMYNYNTMRLRIVTSLKHRYPGADVKKLYWECTKSGIFPQYIFPYIYMAIMVVIVNQLWPGVDFYILLIRSIIITVVAHVINEILHTMMGIKYLVIKQPK